MWAKRNVFRYATVATLMLALLVGTFSTLADSSTARQSRPTTLATNTTQQSKNLALAPGTRSSIAKKFGKAPLSFEANQGQFNPAVKFVAHGAGYQLYLTSTEAVLSLSRGRDVKHAQTTKDFLSHSKTTRDVLRMKLSGSRSTARVSGEDVLSGKVNYLLGNDPRAWRTNVATHQKVRYEDVYPGIDLVYYGNQSQLEYDFQVAPGADPAAIRLAFDGVRRTKVDSQTGELLLRLKSGEIIRQHKPVLYQEVNGARREVAGRFIIRSSNQAGFEVGAYDKSRPLLIDPVLDYVTYFGGAGDEATSGIAVDAAGSVYVTGSFVTSPGFPVTPNAFQKTQDSTHGNGEAFITKFSPDGSSIVYSTLLGGSSTDTSTGIGLDASGNAYVVGWTDSDDFPVRNAFQSNLRGRPNAFLTKLNSSGSDLLYSTFFGGTSNFDFGTDIAVDSSGNAYITGETASTNFPVTPGAYRTVLHLERGPGDQDGFVAKFNTNATGAASLVYSTFCDAHSPYSNSLDIDTAGNVYVAAQKLVQKLNATGSALVYSFTIPDTGTNPIGLQTSKIAVDASGQAYVSGFTNSTGLQIVNGFQPAIGGGSYDGFLVKLNAAGTALLYSTYLGGDHVDSAEAVAVDSSGHAYVVGETASANFPTRDAFQSFKLGGTRLLGEDIFITKIDTNSTGPSSLIFSTFYGATNFDEGASGVALDSAGNIYVTGFPFRIILTGIIHTGIAEVIDGSLVPGDETEFDPFILKITNTSPSTIQFGAERMFVSEGAGSFEVTVTRSGDTSAAANVDYATLDGSASRRSDYTSAYGTLRFAPGETAKTFRVFITDDTTAEGNESLYVILREKIPGVALAFPSVAELTITDNDTVTAPSNPIDKREFFVRQHYLDFLNREPDTDGFNFWVGQISPACDGQPFQPECVDQRVNVSGAFFLAIEFMETGYFAYRVHKASFGSLPHFTPFLRNTQELGRGVIVGQNNWQAQLENNKAQFLAEWVQTDNFKARYDSLTNEQYVDALNANTGNSLTPAERDALVAALNGPTLTRATVLGRVADNEEFKRREFNAAFVLMQYFGYLRRDPDPPGYQFWLNKLNQFGGDFRRADMVKAFIISSEYRSRFAN